MVAKTSDRRSICYKIYGGQPQFVNGVLEPFPKITKVQNILPIEISKIQKFSEDLTKEVWLVLQLSFK